MSPARFSSAWLKLDGIHLVLDTWWATPPKPFKPIARAWQVGPCVAWACARRRGLLGLLERLGQASGPAKLAVGDL